ncbi:type II RES/Xre toxin-antitoxin system antitoxin [Desulfocurvus vexinensis]|uniref:type II RES/Xre toxin-antitoxin system antitoxin n=1 Tax=Desulfocurvus vexinensis TaxID=399548 RepID=UPI00146F9DCF|nr:antitoxin Xre/MbcA/ParS toxin-binding domain-containing protein [Desulfocurvus vexinensis]
MSGKTATSRKDDKANPVPGAFQLSGLPSPEPGTPGLWIENLKRECQTLVAEGMKSIAPRPHQEVLKYIRSGFHIEEIDFTECLVAVGDESIANRIGISVRTLQRRKKKGERLSPEESDRLFRLQQVSTAALGLFDGNMEAMRRWLKTPLPVLGNETPLSYSDTGPGADFVLSLITRLEHGVFS